MTNRRKMINELINSLKTEPKDWIFDQYTAENKRTGVQIWIANTPILNIEIYRPTTIKFNLIDKIRIYKALDECKCAYISKLNCV